ncbi:SGNH/GDSL hydrolase family protein [Verrucomicrobia bacterium LW23]|nr:SGNH/GDSL hydrolase family protein [Verrucomicrobia bacterium LW23]
MAHKLLMLSMMPTNLARAILLTLPLALLPLTMNPTEAFAAAAQADPAYEHLAPASPDPALPNVLLLGDSISIGYQPFVTKALAGVANVYRIKGSEEMTVRPKNGLRLSTDSALANLDGWLGNVKFSVIHFNWGLHDVKQQSGKPTQQVPLEEYKTNLRQLVHRLKATGARLIWATTTPVPPGADQGPTGRKAAAELPYNEAALQIMKEEGIPVNDLHALVAPRLKEAQRPANVHFTDAGSKMLGEQVAGEIRKALGK